MMRRPFRVLYGEFLFRPIDRELLSNHAKGDASKLLLQLAALLIFVSLLASVPAASFTADLHPQIRLFRAWSIEHFLIATTMLVVGLFAVLSWDAMFPDRRDVLVLAPLPVPARTIFLAKAAAIACALSLTVLTLHLLAGIVWPVALNAAAPALRIPARTSDPAMPPVGAAELRAVLDQDFARVRRHGPLVRGGRAGVAIGVSTRGVRRIFTYGAAMPRSIFEIGSMTKPFTGLVLAQMVEVGALRIDQPVRELLPQVRIAQPTGLEITLLDLATHRSGLRGMPENLHPGESIWEIADALAEYDASALDAYVETHGVSKRQDATFRYSNLGFALLGHALATRARTDYETLIRDVITKPLGMPDTVVRLSPEQRGRFLQGYSDAGKPMPAYDLGVLAAAGGLRSTAPDMLTWLEAHLHPERVPVLAAALTSSHRVRTSDGAKPRMSLAWFVRADSDALEHGGATAGFTGYAWLNPQEDSALVVLSNTGPGSVISADILGEHVRARLVGTPAISITEVVIPPGGGVTALLRLFGAYWITMLAAGAFMFSLIMGVQGVAARVLPRRAFLRVSSFLQVGAFTLIVSVYCLQPMLVGPARLVEVQQPGLLAWSPSFWFLGLFQELNGSPALAPLARRALIGLAIALCASALAYGGACVRTLRRTVDEPDIVPVRAAASWLPRCGNGVHTAVVRFSIRTLLRSRQHRLLLAFYAGIGFALTIFLLKAPFAEAAAASHRWDNASVPFIASSVLMLGFWVLGTRVTCALPADLRSNWIFRVTPIPGGRHLVSVVRRALVVLAVFPMWTASAVVMFSVWPLRAAVGHLLVLALLGLILVELSLLGTQKLPFTCSYLPGKSHVHATFWALILLLVPLTVKAAAFERDALEDATRYAATLLALGLVWVGLRWRTARSANAEEAQPQFEEADSWEPSRLDVWDSRFVSTLPDRE